MGEATVLEMRGICKYFPGVKALDHVHLEVSKGEVHALLGENGAGKSTLLKILAGAYTKDEGEIVICGEKIDRMDTKKSEELGISVIYQEFSTLPYLSVAENIFLGNQQKKKNGITIDWKKCYEDSKKLLERVGLAVDPKMLIGELKVAQQQMVEIAKALSKKAKIIVMDEPTAPLTQREIENLFSVIRELKAQGVAIIYVSHRLTEIKQICDRVTFLRDGCYVGDADVRDIDMNDMIRMMVGRDLSDIYPAKRVEIGGAILQVEHLSTADRLTDISFRLHKGEILGVAGLVGAGRTELARALFGADPMSAGEVYVDGKRLQCGDVTQAIRAGIGLVPEDRKRQGLVLMMNVVGNITLSSLRSFTKYGKLSLDAENKTAQKFVKKLRIATPSIFQETNHLSGGNQQKVVLSKWLCANCKVLIIDEPTRGIDVGAKKEIYDLMNELAGAGLGIVMISSEMQELMGVCDRILVMHEGRLTGAMDRGAFDEETIMAYATGQRKDAQGGEGK